MYLIKETHNITCQLQCTVHYKKDNNNNKIIIISVTDLEENKLGGWGWEANNTWLLGFILYFGFFNIKKSILEHPPQNINK